MTTHITGRLGIVCDGGPAPGINSVTGAVTIRTVPAVASAADAQSGSRS
jgi:6-phosphofructokinase